MTTTVLLVLSLRLKFPDSTDSLVYHDVTPAVSSHAAPPTEVRQHALVRAPP